MKFLENGKIGTKIAAIVSGLGVMCLAVAIYGGSRVMDTDTAYSNLNDTKGPARIALARANRAVNQMAFSASMAILTEPGTDQARESKAQYEEAGPRAQSFLDSAKTGLPDHATEIDALSGRLKSAKTALDAAVDLGMQGRDAEASVAMQSAARTVFDYGVANGKLVDTGTQEALAESVTLSKRSSDTRWQLLIIAVIGIAAGMGVALWMSAFSITKPLNALAGRMSRLAGGDLDVDVEGQGRQDEVGLMAKAVQNFKDNGLKARQLATEADQLRTETETERGRTEAERRANEAEQAMVVKTLAGSLERLAKGDLTARIEAQFNGQYAQIKADFNAAVDSLREAMSSISTATSGIRGGSEEIASASDDLSRRTEQQAASLEETAAALDQITATVKRSADGARSASSAASGARADAERSGSVMREAVTAITEIEQSSGQITNIIGVIDEIAFQTNLLALNAGVEAARAGDAGRGFAVVAQEVRALAQRSADAAKEIKALIGNSSSQVERGVKLVGETEAALTGIVSKVAQIDALISEIAQSSQEQATGLNQVNAAVNQMDQVTQQNAAMVEQATAASANLKSESGELARLVSRFQLGGAAQAAPKLEVARAGRHAPAANPIARAREKLTAFTRPGGAQAAVAADTWEEF